MGFSQLITYQAIQSFDSASLSSSYQLLGTLNNPGYIVKVVNNSASLVLISIDGTNDHDVVPASSFFLYDEGKVGQVGAMPALPAGTKFYVKGTASGASPGSELIYLVIQYVIIQ